MPGTSADGPRSRLTSWLGLSSPCVICGIESAPLDLPVCAQCEHDFLATVPRCSVCALRLPSGTFASVCGACAQDAPQFDASFALGDYEPPLSGMVLALKAGGRLALADTFGALLARPLGAGGTAGALVTAVPLAFERQAERGFNQAVQIARRLARKLQLEFAPAALLRIRHAAPQHVLALAERRRNVRGAFAVRADVRERHVIVVDDVMTSGATLDEIAKILKRAGAGRVTNVVVARTP